MLRKYWQVPNHTSDQHEWFKKSVAKEKGFENFYVWHDGYPSVNNGQPSPPNNWVKFPLLALNFKFDDLHLGVSIQSFRMDLE
jgi:glycosidase